MKELLEKVLADVLNEDARNELATTIQNSINEAVDAEVEKQKNDLVVEYATQFAADREALIEAIDTKVTEMLNEQLDELKDDIAKFRDLEVEMAANLVEEKAKLAEAVEQDMAQLVERLDTFLELRLSEEVDELKESIEEVKQINLGRQIFEAFKTEVAKHVNQDSGVDALTAELAEAKAELAKRDEALVEANKSIATAERKEVLEGVLSSLQGRPREIMEAILKTVPTEKLKESYDNFVGRVLNESVTKSSEKESVTPNTETPVLAEGETVDTAEVVEEQKTVVVTGDTEEVINESAKPKPLSENALRLQRLAGITG